MSEIIQILHFQLLISNAPPSDLVIFTKALAAKLAGTKDKPAMSTRAKLLSDVASYTEGISPVTAKVILKKIIWFPKLMNYLPRSWL